MKRDIKFKLLDKTTNKFWLEGKGWDMYSLFVSYRECICQTDKFELMQYTGLKDSNGKEIYEGDIVRYEIPWLDNEKVIRLIKYDETFLGFVGGDKEKTYIILYEILEMENIEIIGNIYENPELLK